MTQLVLGGVEAEISDENVFQGGLLPVREPGRLPTKQKAVLPRFANAPEV
jgi:hypothetical protein